MVGNIIRTAEGIVRKGLGLVAAVASRVAGEPRDTNREPMWVAPEPGEKLADAPPPPAAPGAPGEPIVTEPSAPNRASAHGGPGPVAEDDWRDEVAEQPDVPPVPSPRAGEPLIDPAEAKAIRSESEVLRRGARRSGD